MSEKTMIEDVPEVEEVDNEKKIDAGDAGFGDDYDESFKDGRDSTSIGW